MSATHISESIVSTIITLKARAPDEVYEVKLSTGDMLEGKLAAASEKADHILVTRSGGTSTYVLLRHVVFVRPKST